MRLTALGLSDFKSFRGEHRIELRDAAKGRHVYLFGGLNGAGKTTLSQATVLALHGERAAGLPGLFAAGRDGRKRYRLWLQAAFNQRARATGADRMRAWVELVDGSSTLIVTRSWWFSADGAYLEEQLEVREDRRGASTLLVDDEAQSLVDEVLPRHLLDFAIFDGEQVRRLDDTLSATAVRGALDRLLNLDAVERTRAQVERLARQRRMAEADPEQLEELTKLQSELEDLSTHRVETVDRLREAETERERLQRELDQLAANFDVALSRATSPGRLSEDLAGLRERRSAIRSQIGRHVGEWLFLLPLFDDVPTLVEQVQHQQAERSGRDRLKIELEVMEHMADEMTNDRLMRRRLGPPVIKEIKGWLDAAVAQRRRNFDEAVVSGEGYPLSQFTDAELADVDGAAIASHRDLTGAQELAADLVRVNGRIKEMEELVANADRDSTTSQLLRRRDELNVLFGEQRAVVEQLGSELEAKDAVIASLRSRLAQVEQRLNISDDDGRWLATAEATAAALDEFLAEARADASFAVRDRMLENLRVLLRKDALVADVVIDSATHVTRLIGADGNDVELPSAGEHQLAAMAFIDAVLAASDNPLPVFVDTPLARLDSHHRLAVVRDFWPSLGRQVIVLSTDEEVVDDLYGLAEPSLAATYRIECDADGDSHVIADQYVQEAAS